MKVTCSNHVSMSHLNWEFNSQHASQPNGREVFFTEYASPLHRHSHIHPSIADENCPVSWYSRLTCDTLQVESVCPKVWDPRSDPRALEAEPSCFETRPTEHVQESWREPGVAQVPQRLLHLDDRPVLVLDPAQLRHLLHHLLGRLCLPLVPRRSHPWWPQPSTARRPCGLRRQHPGLHILLPLLFRNTTHYWVGQFCTICSLNKKLEACTSDNMSAQVRGPRTDDRMSTGFDCHVPSVYCRRCNTGHPEYHNDQLHTI